MADFLKLRLVYDKPGCVKIVRICTRASEEGQRMVTDPLVNKYMLSIVVCQLDAKTKMGMKRLLHSHFHYPATVDARQCQVTVILAGSDSWILVETAVEP